MSETSPEPQRSRGRAALRWILLLALLIATAGGGYLYWRHSEIYPTTENAYTQANIVRVSAEVAGPVERVYVAENESVEAGDALLDIDRGPYEAQLRAERAFFDQSVESAGEVAHPLRDAANRLAEARRKLFQAREALQTVSEEQQGETGDALQAEQAWEDALEELRKAQAAFDAEQEVELETTPETSQLRSAAAALDKAGSDLVNTLVNAPASGWVSGISLRPGTTVARGNPLFAIVENGKWWVNANFKETDITRIRPGQEASIRLDMYPDMEITGVVDSISAGSGATFSALPAENATGNWVKVTQRFPVRIRITEPPDDPSRPLRVGASAQVTVDTSQEAQQAALE